MFDDENFLISKKRWICNKSKLTYLKLFILILKLITILSSSETFLPTLCGR